MKHHREAVFAVIALALCFMAGFQAGFLKGLETRLLQDVGALIR